MDLLAVWEPAMVGPQTGLPDTGGCLGQPKGQGSTGIGWLDGRLMGLKWAVAGSLFLVWRYGIQMVQYLWPESMQSLCRQGASGPLL